MKTNDICCLLVILAVAGWFFGAGCAFDISHITEQPALLVPAAGPGPSWTLTKEMTIHVGSGYSTVLKAGSRWTPAGTIAQGDVFRTSDQLVVVQASNNYEALVVRQGNAIVGFYLPVEKTFTAASKPVPIEPPIP